MRGTSRYVLVVVLYAVTATPSTAPTQTSARTSLRYACENCSSTHDWTKTQALEDAQDHDLITAVPFAYDGYVTAMKEANPDLRVFSYMNVAAQSCKSCLPAKWYLRDAEGHKVKILGWSLYLMDPMIAGWINNRRRTAVVVLDVSDGSRDGAVGPAAYDGLFLDNAQWGVARFGISALPINPRTNKVYTRARFQHDILGVVAAISQKVAPRQVIGNSLGNGQRYFDPKAPSSLAWKAMDTALAEGFLRSGTTPIGWFKTETAWKQDVDMLVHASGSGMHVIARTVIKVPATEAQIDRWWEYSFASFLLGTNGDHYFGFHGHGGGDQTDPHRWNGVELGSPVDGYFKTDGVYQRVFSGGMVIVNPGVDGATISLPRDYVNMQGETVTSVTLPPHTGKVLVAA